MPERCEVMIQSLREAKFANALGLLVNSLSGTAIYR